MCDSPQDVYAKCLPKNRGYPLWFPEPSNTLPSSYRRDGLQIGDVGYVDWDGAFNVLFNISYGPNHALHNNRRLGVTFNFAPTKLDVDYEIDVNPNADPPGCIITSPGITQPPPTSQRAGHYEFTPSSAKGAILILPDGATSHKLQLQANERFRKVAVERAFDWYEVAKEHYGGSISNDSLYLITGFYKAPSWSLASFHDATGREDRRIWVVPRQDECTRRDWKRTFPLECRDGPEPGHNGSVNKTIFIRGFKIAVRDDVLGWLSQKPEVQPVPAVRPRKDPCGLARFLRRFSKTSKPPRRGNGDVDVNHVPTLSQPFHPADIMNRYLLKKDPSALVAVTHDSEWIALLETGELTQEELTQEDRLEEFLSENYSVISQPENSTAYLEGKNTDINSSVFVDAYGRTEAGAHRVFYKSEEFWHTGPSSDNFQVDITRIRAADPIAGFGRIPVGFYVLVQFGGTKRRTQNKPVRLHDSIVEWDERIQLPSERSTKVLLHICASFEFSPMLGTGEILRTVELCVGDLDDNTHLIMFPTGEPVSPCSSLHITIERQPSRKLGGSSNHDKHFEWEDSSDLAQFTDQGHDALLRYHTNPRKEIVAVSVGHFERALAACPPNHHCRAAVLCNIARAYFISCQIVRGSMKLSTSISYYREALELRFAGHPDRPATLLHLVEVLLYHYGKLGVEEFPGEIVRLASELQASCSEDTHEHRAADLALQMYALYKAINSVSSVDIDELIPALRQAVQDTPRDYFDRLQRLTNLVLALWIRHGLGGDLGDLDESIAIHEEAAQFTSRGFDSQRHTQLLKERVNATSAGGSWKDALVTAASFVIPRFSIYRVLCERLEIVNQLVDAVECFHAMTNELAWEIQAEEAKWIPAFKSRCYEKLEHLGDIAMNAQKHDDAISRYSVALSLDPVAPQGLFIKRSKMYLARSSWEEALRDANEAVSLDPASPWGYERKYVALQKLGDYENAIDAYEVMLSKIAESADPDIRQHSDQYISPSSTQATIRRVVQRAIHHSPRVLINTATGRLHDRTEQAFVFESLPIFHELVSSMTTRIDYARIKRVVRQYFRYVMLSHTWEEDEPLFPQVIRIAVYDLDKSPTHVKLQTFCKIVRDAGFHWAWSDTCCINNSNHFVVQEALVAMFKWYRGSAMVIVLLRGVRSSSQLGALMRSIWNTRAWTLQEYIAARVIRFYTEDWTPYLNLSASNHKESPEIISEMAQATGVSSQQLVALSPGLTNIREKLRLASTRRTTFVEDAAYSLLGIFSVTGLPVIYGEGESSLGRLLAHLLAGSGDVSILAWTGESGSYNSCLPAHLTVFNSPAASHLPPPIQEAEVEKILARSHTSFDLDVALRLHDHLHGLPSPWFASRRMKLPCIAFQLPSLSPDQTRLGYVYRVDTVAFGMVEIKTNQDLSQMNSLYLIHPWLDPLHEDMPSGDVDVPPPSPETSDDEPVSDEDYELYLTPRSTSPLVPMDMATMDQFYPRARPLDVDVHDRSHLPSPHTTLQPTLSAPCHSDAHPHSRSSSQHSLSIDEMLLEASTDDPRPRSETSWSVEDHKEVQARRLVAHLRQPFGALLVTLVTTDQRTERHYRRVATDSMITVQFQDDVSLTDILDNVRILDIL